MQGVDNLHVCHFQVLSFLHLLDTWLKTNSSSSNKIGTQESHENTRRVQQKPCNSRISVDVVAARAEALQRLLTWLDALVNCVV